MKKLVSLLAVMLLTAATSPVQALVEDLNANYAVSVDPVSVYTVKPGTQSGTRVRLRGKGVPSLRNQSTRGDHYVTLNVQVPTRLTEEAKRALRAYDAVSGNSLSASEEDIKKTQDSKGKKKNFFDKFKDTFEE